MKKKDRKRQRFIKLFLLVSTVSVILGIAAAVFIALYFFFLVYRSKNYVSPLPFAFSSSQKKLSAHEVKDMLRKKSIPVLDIISETDQALRLKLGKGEEVVFSRTKDIEEQVSSLQLMLSRFTIEGKQVSLIDFRFDKPVVVFANE